MIKIKADPTKFIKSLEKGYFDIAKLRINSKKALKKEVKRLFEQSINQDVKPTFYKKALAKFFAQSAKMKDEHNYYVQLEIDGIYQPVAVIDLILQAQLEACEKAVEVQRMEMVQDLNIIISKYEDKES